MGGNGGSRVGLSCFCQCQSHATSNQGICTVSTLSMQVQGESEAGRAIGPTRLSTRLRVSIGYWPCQQEGGGLGVDGADLAV